MTVFISDVHGRIDHLESIVNYIGDDEYIFLGDITDCRNDKYRASHPRCVEDTVQYIMSIDNVTAISSNHNDKLIKYLAGKKVRMTPSFVNTIENVSDNSITWLQSLPSQIIHYNQNVGVTYYAAHAMPGDNRAQNLYGTGCDRWWYTPAKFNVPQSKNFRQKPIIAIAGHWHELFISYRAIILDPFGHSNDGVAALIPIKRQGIITSYRLIYSSDTRRVNEIIVDNVTSPLIQLCHN